MSCGVGCRRSSDPVLLWLWCRLAATALIQPLAWEPPCAAGAVLENTHKKKKKEKENLVKWSSKADMILINLIQTVFVLVVFLRCYILIKSLQCPWLWFQYPFSSTTVSSRKKVKTPMEKRIKEKKTKIKEESQQRNHRTHPNVKQILSQQRKHPSQLEGQFYPEELLISHSSSAWLLL